MGLFLALLVVVVVFMFLVRLMAALMFRVSERMLTGYFRSLEALVELDTLPPAWDNQLRKMADRGTVRTGLVEWLPWQEAAKPFLLKKIAGLRKYFEKSTLVDSPETRVIMLETLDEVKARWEGSELPEILAYYDFSLDVR